MKDVPVEIRAYDAIHKMAKDCLMYQYFYIATGEPGYGKTFACKYFTQNNSDCVIHLILDKSDTATSFFIKLINTIGDVKIKSGIRLGSLIRLAAEKFINSYHNMLLIIDQINKASPNMCEYLHEFRDLTKENTGILLLGTSAFLESLEKWDQKNHSGIREFRSRVKNEFEIPAPNENDVISIIRQYGIKDPDFEKEYQVLKDLRELKGEIEDYERIILKEMSDL